MGAYTKEKRDVLIILRNEPLLFVQGPPVFIRVVTKHEESTSVFVLSGEEPEMASEVELEQEIEQTTAVKAANPSVIRRITYLGTPFSRQVYRPLQFVLSDETLTGTIEKIDGETVFIGIGEDGSELVSVEMANIEEILWRGDPFAED
ncbi:hypothetical protein [Sporosarcina sp. YIM B06819]|uniref:hypothetical protein n=1 Tax=Sporosarcina sp. YIM B06819 TaxID=3081769 RepID=UPI00298CD183|nr:hypothetical protein [Sporosarcina sp. YIM B06819]